MYGRPKKRHKSSDSCYGPKLITEPKKLPYLEYMCPLLDGSAAFSVFFRLPLFPHPWGDQRQLFFSSPYRVMQAAGRGKACSALRHHRYAGQAEQALPLFFTLSMFAS